MARSLDAIIKEMDSGYAPSRKGVQNQLAALPSQHQAQLKGLNAQLDQANEGILNQARQRGVGDWGIPIDQQTKYAATTFAPAVAQLQGQQLSQKSSLLEALNGLNREERQNAMSVRQTELDREQQQRQFEQQLAAQRRAAAAASASAGPSVGDYLSATMGGSASNRSGGGPKMMQKKGGNGFAFTDAHGNPISAASYSRLAGIPFRTLLQRMANAGDVGAGVGLDLIGNDYGVNMDKLNRGFDSKYKSFAPGGAKSIVNALLW